MLFARHRGAARGHRVLGWRPSARCCRIRSKRVLLVVATPAPHDRRRHDRFGSRIRTPSLPLSGAGRRRLMLRVPKPVERSPMRPTHLAAVERPCGGEPVRGARAVRSPAARSSRVVELTARRAGPDARPQLDPISLFARPAQLSRSCAVASDRGTSRTRMSAIARSVGRMRLARARRAFGRRPAAVPVWDSLEAAGLSSVFRSGAGAISAAAHRCTATLSIGTRSRRQPWRWLHAAGVAAGPVLLAPCSTISGRRTGDHSGPAPRS